MPKSARAAIYTIRYRGVPNEHAPRSKERLIQRTLKRLNMDVNSTSFWLETEQRFVVAEGKATHENRLRRLLKQRGITIAVSESSEPQTTSLG